MIAAERAWNKGMNAGTANAAKARAFHLVTSAPDLVRACPGDVILSSAAQTVRLRKPNNTAVLLIDRINPESLMQLAMALAPLSVVTAKNESVSYSRPSD